MGHQMDACRLALHQGSDSREALHKVLSGIFSYPAVLLCQQGVASCVGHHLGDSGNKGHQIGCKGLLQLLAVDGGTCPKKGQMLVAWQAGSCRGLCCGG